MTSPGRGGLPSATDGNVRGAFTRRPFRAPAHLRGAALPHRPRKAAISRLRDSRPSVRPSAPHPVETKFPARRRAPVSMHEVCLGPAHWGSGDASETCKGDASRGRNLLRAPGAACPLPATPRRPQQGAPRRPGGPAPRDPAPPTRRPPACQSHPRDPPILAREGDQGGPANVSGARPPRAPRGSRSAAPSPGSENGGVRLPGAKSESLPRGNPGDAASGGRGEGKLPPDGPGGGGGGRRAGRPGGPAGRAAAAATAVPSAPLFPFQEDPREAEPGNQEVPDPTPPAAAMETAPPPGPARDPASAPPPRPPHGPPPTVAAAAAAAAAAAILAPLPGGPGRPAFPPPGARPAPRGRSGKPGAEARTAALRGRAGRGDLEAPRGRAVFTWGPGGGPPRSRGGLVPAAFTLEAAAQPGPSSPRCWASGLPRPRLALRRWHGRAKPPPWAGPRDTRLRGGHGCWHRHVALAALGRHLGPHTRTALRRRLCETPFYLQVLQSSAFVPPASRSAVLPASMGAAKSAHPQPPHGRLNGAHFPTPCVRCLPEELEQGGRADSWKASCPGPGNGGRELAAGPGAVPCLSPQVRLTRRAGCWVPCGHGGTKAVTSWQT